MVNKLSPSREALRARKRLINPRKRYRVERTICCFAGKKRRRKGSNYNLLYRVCFVDRKPEGKVLSSNVRESCLYNPTKY